MRGYIGFCALASLTLLLAPAEPRRGAAGRVGRVEVRRAVGIDVSAPLASLYETVPEALPACPAGGGCGTSRAAEGGRHEEGAVAAVEQGVPPGSAAVEQTAPGPRPPALLLASFDGHGYGMVGPHGTGGGNNPSDNSLAVGPDHIVEIVNSRLAVYTKRGELFDTTGVILFGPIGTNVLFAGFGGQCEPRPNGDAVVRYDQLAARWLFVMPLFRRAPSDPGDPPGPWGMCYAVSAGPNPLGPYYRYEFERSLFPDYPRPAIWTDGYYVPTSTGDDVIEKHACVVDRTRMLQGLPATEQCIIIPGVNFLNNADIDGWALPPAGAPNILMATGGTQLREIYSDDGIYVWKFHVDWDDPERTTLSGPTRVAVAPYHYLCNGQLTRCVPQPGTEMRLDAQGDKIMQRLVYRRIGNRESIVAVHSVNTSAGGGGVRWYEFRLDENRDVRLFQQGTFAPDSFYRWMASPAMDRQGNIGIGYSFGGTPHYAGQRFAGRLAGDPPGILTFAETVLVEGQASQTGTLRWEDYTQMSMDPADDCTFWYVGDYLKAGADRYTTRIGAFRLPGCLRAGVSGTAFFDVNHNGLREPNEAGLPGWRITYAGARGALDAAPSDSLVTSTDGSFRLELPADAAYFDPTYTFAARAPGHPAWTRIDAGTAYWSGGAVPMRNGTYALRLRDRDDVARVDFGNACVVANSGGAPTRYWLSEEGGQALRADDQPLPETGRGGRGGRGSGGVPGWRARMNNALHLVEADGSRFAVPGQGAFEPARETFVEWLRRAEFGNAWQRVSAQLATTALNLDYGGQAGGVTVHDPVAGDWPAIAVLVDRVSSLIADRDAGDRAAALVRAETYTRLLHDLNANTARVTPVGPRGCPPPF